MDPPASRFTHTLETVRGTPVLHLAGALEGETAPLLRQLLDGQIDGGAKRLVLEVSSLRYVASAGIAVLIAAQKRLRAAGGDLHLAKPSESVKEVLQVLNLDMLMKIHGSVEAALLEASGT